MKDIGDEIWQRVLSYSSLDTLIALEQTSRRFKTLVDALDASIVRDRVQERVPWMELTSEMSSWITCGRVILAKRRSQIDEPEKWTFLNAETTKKAMTRLTRNTDISYDPVINVSRDTLPESFKPLFETQKFWQPNGSLRGKYMTIHRCVLDAVTFDWFHEMPVKDEELKSWYNAVHSNKDGYADSPLSKIRVTCKTSMRFMLVQETERWLLIKEGEPSKEASYYIVDKRSIKGKEIEVEVSSATFAIKEQSLNEYLFQFLPNQKGAFVLQSCRRQTKLHYLDLESNLDLQLLGTFPVSDEDYWYSPSRVSYTQQSKLTTPRDFIVPYGGTLWLNYHERELIPLWADLSVEGEHCGVRQDDMITLRLRPTKSNEIVGGFRTYRLYRSGGDGRFVTHYLACARIVCDLQTGTTHIVKDRGWKKCMGASFIGVDETSGLPQFYTFTQQRLAFINWSWHGAPDTNEHFFGWDDDDVSDTEPYSKEHVMELVKAYEDDDEIDPGTWKHNMGGIRDSARVIDDQSEGPYGAGRYSDHGTDCEYFSSDHEGDESSDEDDYDEW